MTEKTIRPIYKFSDAAAEQVDLQPSKRQLSKTMEVTETFTYYDALAYCMKMEKKIADLNAEIDGLQTMVDAYRKELALIDDELGIVKADEEYHKELQKKLQEEEAAKKAEEVTE